MRNPMRMLVRVGCAVAVVLVSAEWATWRASVDLLAADRRDAREVTAGEVVLVLGHPSRADGRPSALQRRRTRIAVRSTDPAVARLLFTGGPTRGRRSEAAVMAEHAVERVGVPRASIELEEQAATTWENVAFSLPALRRAPRVKIASNPFHARRARRYLLQQAPELAGRLHRAADFRPGEWSPLKPLLVAHECRRVLAERRRARRSTAPPDPRSGGH